MKTVYVCGSFTHLNEMRDCQQHFAGAGMHALLSEPNGGEGMQGCLAKIDQADWIYVVNPDGRIGKSVCVDLGYAIAKGKAIALQTEVSDPPIGAWIRQAGPPEAVLSALKE